MSTPTLTEFDPNIVPWQLDAIKYVRRFDYSKGLLEVLFSGSIGSAKSICAAHLIVTHCVLNKGARCLVVRRALKDLKRTLWQVILKHLADSPELIKSYNKSEMTITLVNGSQIIGDSYDDMNLEKFRSLELSMGAIEEATESEKELYDAIKMRIGRLTDVKENIYLMLTNPDAPDHYLYKEMIEADVFNKKVFYSLTEQNPFLPSWYIENLKRDLDPKMAQRMLYGKWIELAKDVIYYAYNKDIHFTKTKYAINPHKPLDISFDFNIGVGKPMSALIAQYDGTFHIAADVVIEGARTEAILEEMAARGYFENPIKESLQGLKVRIFGDAAGKSRSTSSIRTDYDIIKQFLANFKDKQGRSLVIEMCVPQANPSVRDRHNIVNSYLMNASNEVRVKVYQDAKVVDEGLRLTALKKKADYIEDDSKSFQHVTTALGYYIVYEHRRPKTVLSNGRY